MRHDCRDCNNKICNQSENVQEKLQDACCKHTLDERLSVLDKLNKLIVYTKILKLVLNDGFVKYSGLSIKANN